MGASSRAARLRLVAICTVKMELRPEQLRTFQATGYLVLPSLVDEPTLRAWRAQIWSAIGADAAEPSTWPNRRGTPSSPSSRARPEPSGGQPSRAARAAGAPGPVVSPALHELPAIRAVVDTLSGGGGRFRTIVPEADTGLVFPEEEELAGWTPPQDGHLDGYGPTGWSGVRLAPPPTHTHAHPLIGG